MKRRQFILWSGLGISAIAIPTWYFKFYTPYDQLLIEPELLSHICDAATIGIIGDAYRKKFPNENDELKLAKLLSDHNSTKESTKTIEVLRQQIIKDYTQNNTVMIDGWVLSKTEARQCALFSLTQAN